MNIQAMTGVDLGADNLADAAQKIVQAVQDAA